MRINSITPYRINYNFQYKNNEKNSENKSVRNEKYIMPSFMQFISFQGGNSLNLTQTLVQLDKYSKYPPDIRERITETINSGNKNNKTLIDIHKDKYSKLKDMETLEEIKQAFPEFKDVKSDSEVSYQSNSFISDVKNEKVKYFDSEQDLAVQLLQLYWGDGFSLSDLNKTFTNKHVESVFNKLNIPRVDRVYGQYLKLSDKNYNERYSKELSERLKSAARNKIEREEGIYVPRGPLTEEHKSNISKGLIKYYSENPDKINEMSKRQLEYYENNPEEKEKFSQVLLRAWGYKEAKPVKKALSRFMKIKDVSDEELSDVFNKKSPAQNKLKEFWDRNPWAKQHFSKCMKKSWEKQKQLSHIGLIYEPKNIISPMPEALKDKIYKFAGDDAKGLDKTFFESIIQYDDREKNIENSKYSAEMEHLLDIETEFQKKYPKECDLLADSLNVGINKTVMDLVHKNASTLTDNQINCRMEICLYISKNYPKSTKPISTSELKLHFGNLANICWMYGEKSFAKSFEKNVNEIYNIFDGKPQKVRTEYIKKYFEPVK